MAFLSLGCLPCKLLFMVLSPRSATSQAGAFTEPRTMSQPTHREDENQCLWNQRPGLASYILVLKPDSVPPAW